MKPKCYISILRCITIKKWCQSFKAKVSLSFSALKLHGVLLLLDATLKALLSRASCVVPAGVRVSVPLAQASPHR